MSRPALALTMLSLAALLSRPAPGLAQASPDSQSIIDSLRPTAKDATAGTRGIRPATMQAAEVPSTKAMTEPSHEAPSVKLMVDFRTGSADLTPAAEHTLDQLGKALTSETLSSFRFRIEGHTDTVGAPEANKTLATKRAETVSAYLEKKFTIDAGRLDPEGLGSGALIVQTPDQTPEPRNRVVRVVNLGS